MTERRPERKITVEKRPTTVKSGPARPDKNIGVLPITDIWDWQLKGACRGMDSNVFFHPEGERGPARTNREERAKQICRGCPVMDECRRHALAVREPYGVWGGLSEGDRDEILRGSRRGSAH